MVLGILHDHINRAKHSQVGQARPGFPHFADDDVEVDFKQYFSEFYLIKTLLSQFSSVCRTTTLLPHHHKVTLSPHNCSSSNHSNHRLKTHLEPLVCLIFCFYFITLIFILGPLNVETAMAATAAWAQDNLLQISLIEIINSLCNLNKFTLLQPFVYTLILVYFFIYNQFVCTQ